MRKIVMPPTSHNRAAVLAAVLLGLVWLLSGCGGDGEDDASAVVHGAVVSDACPLVIDDHGLRAFYGVVDRLDAGETVSHEEMGRLFAIPVYDRWRRSFEPERMTQAWAGRMLYLALVGEEGLPERLQQKSRRMDLILAFQEAAARRAEIEGFAAELRDGDLLCETREVLRAWAPAAVVPDTLRVDLIVGFPEMRLFEDRVLLDAGLAWAAGREQLPRFVASLVYKEVASLPGRAPKTVSGDAILLESLRLVHNQVVPTHLDDVTSMVFDRRHSLLAGNAPSPETIGSSAVRTLESLDEGITRLRGRADPADEDWLGLYRLFVGAQSWQSTAWFLGEVVRDRLGVVRLQQAARHPADLLAAYQEASAVPATAPDAAPETLAWHVANPPAFSDANARWLDRRLRAYFP